MPPRSRSWEMVWLGLNEGQTDPKAMLLLLSRVQG